MIAGEGQNSSHPAPTPLAFPHSHTWRLFLFPSQGLTRCSGHVFSHLPPSLPRRQQPWGNQALYPSPLLSPHSSPPYLPPGGCQAFLCRVAWEPLWAPRTDSPEVQGVAWGGSLLQLPPRPKETHTSSETAQIFTQTLFQSESPSFLSNRCPARQNPRRNPGASFTHAQNGWPNHSPAGHEPGRKGPEQAWGEGHGAQP